MKPALPTASVAYGLNGPSATAIVDNATPAGLHLSSGKNCPNKRDRLFLCNNPILVKLHWIGGWDVKGKKGFFVVSKI